ncbi:auxin-binding protein ABP20-like [Euphorbia lathyris]|uniref:auxin-binding protein ABP20-like n=1 Tax=Euphorbia lathyris TaxID=212925 RepID=UPI0033134DE4
MNILSIIFVVLSSFSSSSYAAILDFCVADILAEGPGGFNCKKPEFVTVKDFTFSGLATPGNIINIGNYSLTAATVAQIPGLNGLGLSMGRLDLEVGGVFPMHSHPGVSEIILVNSGLVNVGFITSLNAVYSTIVKAGDVFVFPQGLLHFLINSGKSPAVVYVCYNSEMPGLQFLDLALFGNNLPTDVIGKATFLDAAQIIKLKAVFGGH